MNKFKVFVCLVLLFSSLQKMEATYVWKNGRLIDVNEVATMPAESHFEAGKCAFEEKNFEEASKHFDIIVFNFPSSPYAFETNFYYAVIDYYKREFEAANDFFNKYLKNPTSPQLQQTAWEFKFLIAQEFSHGAKKRCFGLSKFPKWIGGENLAIEIFDEIAAAMPSAELAAKALYAKGDLLARQCDYIGAIDSFQLMIRRFPKNEMVAHCYLAISKAYLQRAEAEFQNPDLLALAELNEKRMAAQLPRHEFLALVTANVDELRETFAKGLYETGCFYEKIHKPEASKLYYRNAINSFPNTKVARLCQSRLESLSGAFCAR